ncbi:MAG: hypothetical protein ACK4Z6_00475 [Candidatus Methylomirabilales bacterium]
MTVVEETVDAQGRLHRCKVMRTPVSVFGPGVSRRAGLRGGASMEPLGGVVVRGPPSWQYLD